MGAISIQAAMASLKFRVDTEEVNEHGQTVGYTRWMGGPTLARIIGAVCDDNQRRTAYITGEPDTFFSVPARVNVGKRSVSGWLGVDDGLWRFHGDCG
jgi:hypothetical protein